MMVDMPLGIKLWQILAGSIQWVLVKRSGVERVTVVKYIIPAVQLQTHLVSVEAVARQACLVHGVRAFLDRQLAVPHGCKKSL